MRRKKFTNRLLYIIAAVFLAYHLLPLVGIAQSLKPKQPSRAQLAQAATCTAANSELSVPTFGDPLNDPLTVDLARSTSLVRPVFSAEVLYDQGQLASLNGWEASTYGNNDGIPTKRTYGSSPENIFRVDIQNVTNGDSKWLSPKLPAKSGDSISVSFDYRSNQEFKPVAVFIDVDGDTQYVTQQLNSASETWRGEQITFVVPPGTVAMRFTNTLEDQGWLETTNYVISRQPVAQLKEGIATFTFDDGWKSIHDQGLPLFNKYDIKTTQYVVASYDGNPAYMNTTMIEDFQKAGHEIGSHSYSHADHPLLGADKLRLEVAGSRLLLNTNYRAVNNYATPFGRYNDTVTSEITQCYQSHRTTDQGYNEAGYDRYHIKVQNVEVDTTPQQIRAWADFARENKLWLVLVYHQVENGGEYSVDSKVLEAHIKAVKDSGIRTATFERALLETYPQGR